MLFLIYTMVCIGFLLVAIRWIFGIFYTKHWVSQQNAITLKKATSNTTTFFVIIPVLAEVGRIEKTVAYFMKTFSERISLKLILVTTEAEYRYHVQGPTSIDVCSKLAEQFKNNVIHLHYPRTDGRMPHQLNFAIKSLDGFIKPNNFITIYNADSKPHPLTFDWVLKQNKINHSQQVFQQYGDYMQNINNHSNSVLLSAALWQNRWAIGFELYKALRSVSIAHKSGLRRPLNYVIGHGLFMTKAVYDKSIGFSEVFHNEDAILGLEISFLKEKIMPLPFFDISDTPDTVKSLYTQKIHWFFGPYQAFSYYTYLLNKYHLKSSEEKLTLGLQSFKLFAHAIYWVAGPSLMVFAFIYPLIVNEPALLLLSYSLFLLFFAIPNYLSASLFKQEVIKPRDLIKLATGGLICYILHGLSALSAIALSIQRLLAGREIVKGKTEMKSR